jgi:hypothetical protein
MNIEMLSLGLQFPNSPGLFERLGRRREFYLELDEGTKAYIWKHARRLKAVDIYLMEEPRGDLIVQDRRDFLDPGGNLYEPVSVKCEYEYSAEYVKWVIYCVSCACACVFCATANYTFT